MKTMLSSLGIASGCIQSPVQAARLKAFRPGKIWPVNNGSHANCADFRFLAEDTN